MPIRYCKVQCAPHNGANFKECHKVKEVANKRQRLKAVKTEINTLKEKLKALQAEKLKLKGEIGENTPKKPE